MRVLLLLGAARRVWWRRLWKDERGNVLLNSGSGGNTCATDSISSVDHQLVKVEFGAAGSATQVSSANPLPVTIPPVASGGYTNLSINAAASNNATSVKGSAGQVYGVHVYNNAAYPVYVKLYNKASSPAPATDNALLVRRIGVQAGTQRDVILPSGLPFGSGIALAIVKGITDTDNTSVSANDCLAEVEYA